MLQLQFDRDMALARIPQRQPDGSLDGVLYFQAPCNPDGPGLVFKWGNFPQGCCVVNVGDGQVQQMMIDAQSVIHALAVLRDAVREALVAQGVTGFTVEWRDQNGMVRWDNSDVDSTLSEPTAILAMYLTAHPIIVVAAQSFTTKE